MRNSSNIVHREERQYVLRLLARGPSYILDFTERICDISTKRSFICRSITDPNCFSSFYHFSAGEVDFSLLWSLSEDQTMNQLLDARRGKGDLTCLYTHTHIN